MTKPNIQTATKELKAESEAVLSQLKSVQTEVQRALSQMRGLEKSLQAEQKQEAQQSRQDTVVPERMTAYVMPDDDVVEVEPEVIQTQKPAAVQEIPVAPPKEEVSAEAQKNEKSVETTVKTDNKTVTPPDAAPTGIRFVRRASDAPPKVEEKPAVKRETREQRPQQRPAAGGRPTANNASRPQGQTARRDDRPQQGNQRNDRRGPAAPAAVGAVPLRPEKRKMDVTAKKPEPQRTRSFDDRNKGKTKKAAVREMPPSFASDEERMGSRKRKNRRPAAPQKQYIEPIKIEHAVLTTETVTVKELSEKIGKPAAEIIKKLFLLGIMATINQELDFDTCELIASEYDITLEQNIAKTAEEVMTEAADLEDDETNLAPRPPVVTIMGHVDHGKTSLLDAIRKSHVSEGEAGGITQHIGAYTVELDGRVITFLDTPGHEAFTAMRARGAQATDIAILVVAADDGIMPQTIEAINHAKEAKVPIIVAINKMDKPDANPDRVMQQLTEQGLVVEEWGGDVIAVPVSAKSREGLDRLLEMVLLVADVEELRANPERLAKGIIIEAQLDKGRGPVATVLIKNGTLHVGDNIIAGTASGRVRAMINDRGERVEKALPSYPVEVLGFGEVPEAGDLMNAVDGDKFSRLVAQERKDKIKAERVATSQVSLDNLFSQIAAGQMKELNVIIKADVQGSVEAMKQSLEKLSNDEVRVRAIHGGVGAITVSDINFAAASNAIIIGFNVRPNAEARDAAEKEGVDMRLYRVIYNAIEDIENAIKGLLEPVYKEEELGQAEVRNTFKVTGVGTIAGCYVKSGKVVRNAQVRLVRDGIVVHEGKIESVRRFKDDVKEVASGYECGIGIEGYNDVKEGDMIEAFEMIEIKS